MNLIYCTLLVTSIFIIYLNDVEGFPLPKNIDGTFIRIKTNRNDDDGMDYSLEMNRIHTRKKQSEFTDRKGERNVIYESVKDSTKYKEKGSVDGFKLIIHI